MQHWTWKAVRSDAGASAMSLAVKQSLLGDTRCGSLPRPLSCCSPLTPDIRAPALVTHMLCCHAEVSRAMACKEILPTRLLTPEPRALGMLCADTPKPARGPPRSWVSLPQLQQGLWLTHSMARSEGKSPSPVSLL